MSEMLFVEVLRHYADELPQDQTGWLAGMRDPGVGRALALMHARPAEDWTLERLADEAAISRSTLHERFVHLHRPAADAVPGPAGACNWRRAWLRDTDAKVIDVALEVGYENEAAFARAFRRAVGESPGRVAPGTSLRSGRKLTSQPAVTIAEALEHPSGHRRRRRI